MLAAISGLGAVIALGWCALVLHYTAPGPPVMRNTLAGLAVLAPLVIGVAQQSMTPAIVVAAIVFAVVLAWFLSLVPPQIADWQRSVAELPRADLEGDTLTISNVRDFDYRSQNEYTPRWRTKSYDLTKLTGLDMFFSHWSSPAIAHTIMSWSFADGRHLAISIETRYRVGQKYSTLAGFFRQYPIYYVVADERDVIRLRTNFRREHVWLYRLQTRREAPRALLLDYIDTVNRLERRPAWYNALTDNCTTTIRRHARHLNPNGHAWNWRLLVNGYLPELLYDQGLLDTSMPFSKLREISNIDGRASTAACEDYSTAIRVGLPNPRQDHAIG